MPVCINHAVKTDSSRLSVANSCRIHPKQAAIATSMLSSKLVRYNLDLLKRKHKAAVSFLNWHNICAIHLYWGGRKSFRILTKPGTYLDLKKIWNPIDFQGQWSKSQGLIFRRGDTPRFALPLFWKCILWLVDI